MKEKSVTARIVSSPPPFPIFLPETEAEANHAFIFDGPEAGFTAFMLRANAGSAAAQAVVAYLYLNKMIDDKCYLESAKSWARKSADQGDAYGSWVLAWSLLESGDIAAGITCLLESAESQFSPAVFDLGSLLFYGAVFPKDQDAGFALFRRAASMGHNNARLMLESGYKLGAFGNTKMILMRCFQPVLKIYRAISWLIFSRKFAEDRLVYVRRLHVENALRRDYGDESLDFELENLLDAKIDKIRNG